MTELSDHNPIDHLEPLAAAHVPVFHIHGDIDTVVPLETNSIEMMEKYRRLEGSMTVRVVKGKGHDLWPGWFHCQEMIDFMIHHGK
jgi:predicted esterase